MKDLIMRKLLVTAMLSTALAACNTSPKGEARQGFDAIHVPVVSKTDYVYDASTAGGSLSSSDAARLDGWFAGMGLDWGDTIYVAGDYSPYARSQVAEIAGRYGMLISQGAPAAAGAAGPGTLRVIVSRSKATVPGCPDWADNPAPNYDNMIPSNYGCGVNANLAAQVANPEDLLHGKPGKAAEDAEYAAKAIIMYRNWPLTAIKPGQELRTFKNTINTVREKD